MGTNKRRLPAAAKGVVRERRIRARRPLNGSLVPGSLVAKPPIPKPQTKHHSYFEFVENKEKKKKLHFQNTHDRYPPRGCEFVPVGNPELTAACKELSRERGIQIYIVSDSHAKDVAHSYASQMNRVGYHFHKAIVQEARANIVGLMQQAASVADGEPEPIPESQELYHMQVDAALRDLFPRIPHTDRQVIIQHAFTRVSLPTRDRSGNDETKYVPQNTRSKSERVGLQPDITLARRVQLAVLAHIRHSHTRYDELLKECSWNAARRTVEALCLDTLVKWRGDEETGRDQLDEILREIVVISDSEDEVSTDDDSVVEVDTPNDATLSHQSSLQPSPPTDLDPWPRRAMPQNPEPSVPPRPSFATDATNQGRTAYRTARRGFQRYRRAWDEAVRRRDYGGQFVLLGDGEEALEQHTEYAFCNSHGFKSHSGSAPNLPALNGYLAQGPPVYRQVPGNAPTAPVNAAYDEEVSVAREQSFKEARLHWQNPPVAYQFRDMLVRSVESALPEAGHLSFGSGTPVGTEDRLENHSVHQGTNHRQSRAPSPVRQPRYGEYGYSGRRVISDHWPHGRVLPGSLRAEGSVQLVGGRDLNFCHSDGRGNPESVASLPYVARGHEAATSSNHPAVTDRLVVNASWPGTHSNPILMEDRGGFFERVAGRPELVPPPPGAGELFEVRPPSRQVLRAPPRHPSVPRTASRGLPDGPMPMRSEVNSTRRPGAIPSAIESQSALGPSRVFSSMWEHDGRDCQEQRRYFAGDCDPHLRLVSGERRTPSTPPYREELRVEGLWGSVTHATNEPRYQPCRKRPASDYHHESYRRENPSRLPLTEHVNVAQ